MQSSGHSRLCREVRHLFDLSLVVFLEVGLDVFELLGLELNLLFEFFYFLLLFFHLRLAQLVDAVDVVDVDLRFGRIFEVGEILGSFWGINL